jgi:hypothetical protein
MLDSLDRLAYIQGVFNQLHWNTWHIRWARCEYVSVVSEETGEREFLFLPEVVTDKHPLGWVGMAEADLLHCWCGIQGGLNVLLLWDGEVGRGDLLGFSHYDSLGAEATARHCDLQGLVVALK